MIARVRALVLKVLGAGGPLVAGRLASAALTFCLPLILARLLTPDQFGTYKQFFLVASTIWLTCQLGLAGSLSYFLPRGGKERGSFVAQTFLSLSVLGGVLGVALWLTAPYLGAWLGDGTLASLRAPLAIFAGTMLTAVALESAIIAEGKMGKAAIAYVVSDAVRATALVAGAYYAGPRGLYWAAAATGVLRVLGLFFIVGVGIVPFSRPHKGMFKAQLAYALPFAGAMYLYVAQRYFAQYAVSASFDAATFALFSVASFHMPVVDIVFAPLSEVMIVQIGKALHTDRPHDVWVAWNDTVQKLASILLPAAACAWLFGPTLLPLLFTHKYDASVPLFMLVTVEMPLWILPLDALLRAADETRFLFVLNGARVALTAALVLGGIHAFGLPGAIVGGIVSEALARIAMMARGRRFLGVGWTHVLDFAALGRTAGAAAIACVPAYGARMVVEHGLVGVLAGAAVYGATYVSLTFVLGRLFRSGAAQTVGDGEPGLVVGR